jgi:hypothetical protein
VPALSVVKNAYTEEEKLNYNNHKGYVAGSSKQLRITDFSNVIPVEGNFRAKFASTNGKNFE